jgi:two-component system, LytTR family, sensor kinase
MLFWRRSMYSRKVLAWSLAAATSLVAFSLVLAAVGANRSAAYGSRDIALGMIYPYSWAFEVPLLAPFFGRYPLVGRPWRRALGYCGVGVVAALGPVLVNRAAWFAAGGRPRSIFVELLSSLLVFWMIAGVFQAVIARQHVRDLEGQLARAELQNLKSQLHPHFLFNTLHTISVLTREDPEAAHHVVVKLSDLLRVSLHHSRSDQVPLEQELDFLDAYLSIERVRLQERLGTSVTASGEARMALIPALLLQPIVENALRHGIGPRAAGGSLAIEARRHQNCLEVKIEDDGVGLAADYAERRARGQGILNTEARLRALYGDAGKLEVWSSPGCGVRVNISLPYRLA